MACNPRRGPRRGTRSSRVYRAAAIVAFEPPTPRIRRGSRPRRARPGRRRAGPRPRIPSISTAAPWWKPACFRLSTTDGWRRGTGASICRCAIRTGLVAAVRPHSDLLPRSEVDVEPFQSQHVADDLVEPLVAEIAEARVQACGVDDEHAQHGNWRSLRFRSSLGGPSLRHTMTSGWIPRLRNSVTECW